MIGSSLGLPLSTTHCMIGSLGGIYLSGKSKIVSKVYWDSESTSKDTSEASKLNMGTLKKILFWWAITVPMALGSTLLVCSLLLKNL